MASWLERYRQGDRDQVWLEMRQLGAQLTSEQRAEAADVCDEMASRARHNVELLTRRLAAAGYRFHSNDDERTPVEPWLAPTGSAGDLVAWLAEQVGPIPLTLSSWVRLVGDVWLVGTHPAWEAANEADPLVIEVAGLRWPDASVRDFYLEELEAWRSSEQPGDQTSPFVLSVAPDHLHKANVSGGAPYGFRLPDGCVDGLFVAEVAMPFVDYLNRVFQQGGFLGSPDAAIPWDLRRHLTEGILRL